MSVFSDMPIKRKVTLVILLSSVTSLLLASVAVFAFQVIHIRSTITHDLAIQGQIIAANSTAAVVFNDSKAATEILSSLKVNPHVLCSCLYLPDRRLFAHDGSESDVDELPPGPLPGGFQFVGPHVLLFQPVILNGKQIALLYLRFDFKALELDILKPYAIILGVILFVSCFLALLLSSRLQKIISVPIFQLAETARVVAQKKDYSVRAGASGRNEIGLLTDAFNRMLDHIEDNDRHLRTANRSLEAEIAERERTERELRESRQRFEVAVQGSSDGLWDWNLLTQQIYFSPRLKNMVGYDDAEFPNAFEELEKRLHPDDRAHFQETIRNYLGGKIPEFQAEFRLQHKNGKYCWILSRGIVRRDETGRPVRFAGSHTDITPRKAAEAELARLNEELVETSRHVGMAEITTGVLHNIGNVLNSANVSVGVIRQQLHNSSAVNLGRVVELLKQHADDLGGYLTADAKGKLVPSYLAGLANALNEENKQLYEEANSLIKNIDHIKDIITTQQNFARLGGAVEDFPVHELIEDALRMSSGGFARRGVNIQRVFQDAPPVRAAKPKVMQILINLFRNATQAMDASRRPDKALTICVGLNGNQRVKIAVSDNGVGIPPENLQRIFKHGFTTKSDGHGFGLHSCVLAAKEMEGDLTVASDGAGKGATFTLELPIATAPPSAKTNQKAP